jgi:hypothetical protein
MLKEHDVLREEHSNSHKETLQVLKEADQTMAAVQESISKARQRLKAATEKYEERYYGPSTSR